MKAKVRETARWAGVALFGWIAVAGIIGGLTNLNSFVSGVAIGGIALLIALLLIAYRPRR